MRQDVPNSKKFLSCLGKGNFMWVKEIVSKDHDPVFTMIPSTIWRLFGRLISNSDTINTWQMLPSNWTLSKWQFFLSGAKRAKRAERVELLSPCRLFATFVKTMLCWVKQDLETRDVCSIRNCGKHGRKIDKKWTKNGWEMEKWPKIFDQILSEG